MAGGILQVSVTWNDVPVHAHITVDGTEPWREQTVVSGTQRVFVSAGSHDLLIWVAEQTLQGPTEVHTALRLHSERIEVGEASWGRETTITLFPPFRAADLLLWETKAEKSRAPITLHGVEIVRIFYATDRARSTSSSPNEFYGNARDENRPLELGWCDVSIPQHHTIGEIERPRWWRLEWSEDPKLHVVLLDVSPEDDSSFFAALRARVESAPAREQALVFIHGYNVRFDDAMRRTAQIAHDLKFKGAAIAYSWPAEDQFLAYPAAEGTAIWTTPHFEGFLSQLSARSGARTIHLIGHSLGNRIMADALKQLSKAHPDLLPMFNQVVLTAPDIDRAVFQEMADAVKKTAQQVTIYISSNDEALVASAQLHKFARVGLAPPNPLVLPGVDTIDASSVNTSFIGHSYAQEASAMLADISELIRDARRAGERFGLGPVSGGYWEFKPRRD